MKRRLPAFDVLVDMARNHPQRLDDLRRVLTQDIIKKATTTQKRKRLEGLQFQVDMERKRARTPLQATIKISEMMCHSLAELHKSMVTPLLDETQPMRPRVHDVSPEIRPGQTTKTPIDTDNQTSGTDNKPEGKTSATIIAFPFGSVDPGFSDLE